MLPKVVLVSFDIMRFFCVLGFLICCLSGCLGVRWLSSDEKVLTGVRVTASQALNKKRIRDLLEEQPNSRLLYLPLAPSVYFYYKGKKQYVRDKYETKIKALEAKHTDWQALHPLASEAKRSKRQGILQKKIQKQRKRLQEGNFWMRIGEPLSIYKTSNVEKSKQNIYRYLHSKGYYDAKINYVTNTKGKKVQAYYTLDEGPLNIISEINYDIPYAVFDSILRHNKALVPLYEGMPFEEEVLHTAHESIYNLMLEHGYYYFSKESMLFLLDTLGRPADSFKLTLKIEVLDSLALVPVFIDSVYMEVVGCLLYTSPSPRDRQKSRMPSSA